MNDFRPHIYKLTDYGKRSKKIDGDLPKDSFIRVVREDTERKGLLYAGGEKAMYVSFDDGAHWQSLQLNLPPVPVTDLQVRQGDLVAATQGRGFWVLDDLSAIRQADSDQAEKPLHLFTPGTVQMLLAGGRAGSNEGKNPPRGALLNYHIRDEHEGPLSIVISDSDGNIVRSYSSEESDFERCVMGNADERLPYDPEYPSTEVGANRWAWDMRSNGLHCVEDLNVFEGFDGALVMPGTYTATVRIGDAEANAELVVVPDPRVVATPEEFAALGARIETATTMVNELLHGVEGIRKARSQVKALMEDYPDAQSLQTTGASAVERLTAWEEKAYQVEFETYEDEDNLPPKLIKQTRHLLDVLDSAGPPVAAGAEERLRDLQGEWAALKNELQAIYSSDIAAVNRWAAEQQAPHVSTL
jgi:hypothetical protein